MTAGTFHKAIFRSIHCFTGHSWDTQREHQRLVSIPQEHSTQAVRALCTGKGNHKERYLRILAAVHPTLQKHRTAACLIRSTQTLLHRQTHRLNSTESSQKRESTSGSHELEPLSHHTAQLQITWNSMELSLEQSKRKTFFLQGNRIYIDGSWALERKAISLQSKKVTRSAGIRESQGTGHGISGCLSISQHVTKIQIYSCKTYKISLRKVLNYAPFLVLTDVHQISVWRFLHFSDGSNDLSVIFLWSILEFSLSEKRCCVNFKSWYYHCI